MDLMGMLGGLIQQVEGGQTPPDLHQHMDNAASSIPQGDLGSVLSHVFSQGGQGNGTPDFGSMLGSLFGQSSGGTQANVLNGLITAAGPALLGSIISNGGLSGLAGMFGGGAPRQLSPAEAGQIPPEEVEQLAKHVQQHDPGIMDRMGSIYSAHPTLVKSLGTGAMILALRKISEMQQSR